MSDRTAGVIGVAVLIAIVVFIGQWFGWKTVLWIAIGSFIVLLVIGLLSKK